MRDNLRRAGGGPAAKTVGTEGALECPPLPRPEMNGLVACREMCRKCEGAKGLMLTQYDDEENVRASREAGALGFIPKAAASSRLLTGIRSVARGDQSWIEALGSQPYR